MKRQLFKIAARTVMRPLHRQMRGMTLGARTAAIDTERRVLLVRHGYSPGWILPGGGVERGETVFAAALRELREEAGIVAEEEPQLHGLFCNHEQFPGDHIACFVLRRFTREPFTPSAEIAAAEFFTADALPSDTTAGTRRRIEEILFGRPIVHHW
jgi:8-oxo-dGTP pyrophosphatase MutT (NUDIX family)